MRKAVLIVALLGLVLLAAFLLTLETRRASVTPEREAPPQAEAKREGAELVMPEVPPVAEEPATAPVVAQEPAQFKTKAPASPTRAGAPAFHLSGTVVVVDEQGLEHPAEDGSFTLLCLSGTGGETVDVAVYAGSWNCAVERKVGSKPLDGLEVKDFLLRGRAAFLEGDRWARLPIPDDAFLALHVHWPLRSILHVRDRSTGRELAPVLGVNVNNWPIHGLLRPPPGAKPTDLGPSPVEIARDGPWFTGFVRSPGYAWNRVDVDTTTGGERFVELDPSGDLDVLLAGEANSPGPRLRLYAAGASDRTPVFDGELGEDGTTVAIDGLAPGSFRVSAEIGNWWSSPLKLGEIVAEVTAGARTHVRLAFESPPPVAHVPLAGVLILPSSWELENFSLDFELLDASLDGSDGRFSIASAQMTSEPTSPERHRWSAEPIQPGRYDVKIDEPMFHVVLEVPTTGLSDARIEVPPPCEVAVRCVDEDTGVEVLVAMAPGWTSVLPQGLHDWFVRSSEWDPTALRWRFRAPVGGIVVTDDDENNVGRLKTELHAGWNEVELRVAPRNSGIAVVLRDGTSIVPLEVGSYPRLEPAEGQDAPSTWRWHGNTLKLLVRQPGRFTLKVPPLQGYEPVPDEVVEIEKGVVKEHVIELRRKP